MNQISMPLLTCRLSSTTANYEASTKTAQIHKNEALDKTKTVWQQREK
jgi:hypothetical protein